MHKSHNFQLKPGYRANYACRYCGVEMIGDSRADNPCENANLYVINQELNELPWEPPLTNSAPIADRVLAYRPKPKTKAAKRRKRRDQYVKRRRSESSI